MVDREALKEQAADAAAKLIESGMIVGLGTGSTAHHLIEAIGRLAAQGLKVTVVPSSRATAELAGSLGLEVVEEPDHAIDIAIDGADEIDPSLGLIKGGGGALFREKLVAEAARRFIVIADTSKLVERLGQGPLPVEILPFMWRTTLARLGQLGLSAQLRSTALGPFVTDNGNLIADVTMAGGFSDAEALAGRLAGLCGVCEHGLFINLATAALVAGPDGVKVMGSIDEYKPVVPFGPPT